jgi:DNA repair protein RadC
MPRITFTSSPPGASTFVNGVYRGITPFTEDVKAGEVDVVFWRKGFRVGKYADIATRDGQSIGTSLEQDDEVQGPPDMAPPVASQAQPAALQEGSGSSGARWAGVLLVAALGSAGAFWWYRRRGRSGRRQHSGRAAQLADADRGRYRKPRSTGSTPISTRLAGLGAVETTCSAAPPGSLKVQTCVTRPREKGPSVSNAGSVCKLLRNAKHADRESFFTISLDPGLRVLGIEETHKGSVDEVNVHPREVFKSALLLNASSVVVAHNHPSGNAEPSADDVQLTKRLVKAGRLVGVPVLDHIVVADDGCKSIFERDPKIFAED